MRNIIRLIILSCAFLTFPFQAMAAADCTMVVDFDTSAIVHEGGDCKTRRAPESTFKIPLAFMGYDSGILKDAHNPVWDYDKSYNAFRKEEKEATDPTRWEKLSVVWYSQKLTRTMGIEKFKTYVQSFEYGNMDVSGDKGKNNGLTHAWLSSSLKISPIEQIGFVRKILNKEVPVSPAAADKAVAIIPVFETDGWAVHGKTGSGFERNADGTLNRALQRGWFVGWAEKDGRKVIFAKFIADTKKQEGYAGLRTREAFLKELPGIMARERHNEH